MTGPGGRAGAELELERVVRRWQQLPLDHALRAVPDVASMVQQLADAVSDAEGLPRDPVPDLGPAVLMDQLRVMAYDWQQAGLPMGDLADRLTTLRRSLP
jgi:hypothetical protein